MRSRRAAQYILRVPLRGAQRFFLLALRAALGSNRPPLVRPITQHRGRVALVALLLWCGFSAVLLTGCADAYYVDTIHRPEARYDTYHGPYYYPYYPWYAYYGGAYSSGE